MPRGEKLKLQNFPTPEDCDDDGYEDNIHVNDTDNDYDDDFDEDDGDDGNLSSSSGCASPPP